MLKTRLTELLDIRYPIISAPMVRMSGGRLAGAISAGGGLGTFGGAAPVASAADPAYIREQIDLIRSTTGPSRDWGVMPPWQIPALYWRALQIDGPTLTRAFRCRPRSGPEPEDRRLAGTIASVATCSFAD